MMSASGTSSDCSSRSSARSSPPLPPNESLEMDVIEPNLETLVFWCGGKDTGQDTTIRLILGGNPEPLAEVRVHSCRLRTYSKYFAAALSPSSSKRKRTPLEYKLQVFADVEVYSDCFARMYAPFEKSFKDVNSSLQLLYVAAQIEFKELSRSICLYLSSVPWSGEDELKIRRCMASPQFPRRQAKELVARMDRKEDRVEPIRLLIQQCMHSLHRVDNCSSRVFLEELLKTARVRQTESSTFEKDLVTIINDEAKRMIVDVHMNYNSHMENFQRVRKLMAVYSVLEALLGASLGEAGVACFLRLENYPSILSHAARGSQLELYSVAHAFAGLLLSIGVEAAVGNLLLGIRDRVALLENWHPLFQKLDMAGSFQRMAALLFPTLPFQQQMELLHREARKGAYDAYMSPRSLALLWEDSDPLTSRGPKGPE